MVPKMLLAVAAVLSLTLDKSKNEQVFFGENFCVIFVVEHVRGMFSDRQNVHVLLHESRSMARNVFFGVDFVPQQTLGFGRRLRTEVFFSKKINNLHKKIKIVSISVISM